MTMKVAASLILMLVVLLTAFSFGQPILNNVSQAIAENIPGVENDQGQVQDRSAYAEYASSIKEFGEFISELRNIESGSLEKQHMCMDYIALPSDSFFEEFTIRFTQEENTFYVDLLQTQEQLGDQDDEKVLAAREEFSGLCILDNRATRNVLDEIWGRTQGDEFVKPLITSKDNQFSIGVGGNVYDNLSEATKKIFAAYKQGSFDNIGLSPNEQESGITQGDPFEHLVETQYLVTGETQSTSRARSLPPKTYTTTKGEQENIIMKEDQLGIAGFGGELCLFTERNPEENPTGGPAILKMEQGNFVKDTAYFFQDQNKLEDIGVKYQPTVPRLLRSFNSYACTPQNVQGSET